MATEKKQSISKHKRAPAKRAANSAQTFDIIPPRKVMPSASSRPIITPTKPAQSDNTLTSPSILGPKRARVVDPGQAAAEATGQPDMLEAPQADAADQGSPAEPVAQATKPGSSPLGNLSPQQANDIEEQVARALAMHDDNDAATTAEPVDSSSADIDDNGPKLPKLDDDQDDAGIVADTVADDKPAHDTTAEEPAADQSEPVTDEVPATEDEPTPADSEPEPADQPEPTDRKPQLVTSAKTAAKPASAATPAAVAAQPAGDTLADVLANDGAAKPQEHSPALKDALQDLDSDASKPEHHELYGGKPVIVIHKQHRGSSFWTGLLWFIICLAVALVVIDLLIDANILSLSYNLPTTHFFH